MRTSIPVSLSVVLSLTLACAEVAAPLIGLVRDHRQNLRPVWGVAGAFVTGAPLLDGVSSAASSGAYTLARTADAIVVFRGTELVERREAAGDGPVSFGFDAKGRPAWVRFAAGGPCLTWNGAACPEETPEQPTAEDAEPAGDGWRAVRRPSGVFLIRADQQFQLPEAQP